MQPSLVGLLLQPPRSQRWHIGVTVRHSLHPRLHVAELAIWPCTSGLPAAHSVVVADVPAPPRGSSLSAHHPEDALRTERRLCCAHGSVARCICGRWRRKRRRGAGSRTSLGAHVRRSRILPLSRLSLTLCALKSGLSKRRRRGMCRRRRRHKWCMGGGASLPPCPCATIKTGMRMHISIPRG